MKINILFLFALSLALVSDLGSKFYLLYIYLKTGSNLDISQWLGDLLRIDMAINRGGIFNLFEDNGRVFFYTNFVSIFLLIVLYIKCSWKNILFSFATGLIMGGLLANFIDRLVHKGVIGFISIRFLPEILERWPSFNLADFWILFGGFLILLVYIYEERTRKYSMPSN